MTQPIMRSLVGTPRDEKDNVARFPLSEKMARRLTQKREQIEPAYLRNTGGAQ